MVLWEQLNGVGHWWTKLFYNSHTLLFILLGQEESWTIWFISNRKMIYKHWNLIDLEFLLYLSWLSFRFCSFTNHRVGYFVRFPTVLLSSFLLVMSFIFCVPFSRHKSWGVHLRICKLRTKTYSSICFVFFFPLLFSPGFPRGNITVGFSYWKSYVWRWKEWAATLVFLTHSITYKNMDCWLCVPGCL